MKMTKYAAYLAVQKKHARVMTTRTENMTRL